MAKTTPFPLGKVYTTAELEALALASALSQKMRPESVAGIYNRTTWHSEEAIFKSPEAIYQQQVRGFAAVAWLGLKYWKRIRWTVCAKSQWLLYHPPAPANSYSGFHLFCTCWRDQMVKPGALPISPCARRRTDPNASPFDFTP